MADLMLLGVLGAVARGCMKTSLSQFGRKQQLGTGLGPGRVVTLNTPHHPKALGRGNITVCTSTPPHREPLVGIRWPLLDVKNCSKLGMTIVVTPLTYTPLPHPTCPHCHPLPQRGCQPREVPAPGTVPALGTVPACPSDPRVGDCTPWGGQVRGLAPSAMGGLGLLQPLLDI